MAHTYRILHRPFLHRKALYWLMIPELAFTVALLVLFGLQQPDLFRSLFWRIGYDNQLNSNPNMILYAYANHRPLPAVPFVWSQMITNFNVAICIVSLFVLITKLIMIIMHIYYPFIATLTAIVMTGLYAASVGGQAGPDYADARYRSPVPWYLRKSCDFVQRYGNTVVGHCRMAKGAFAVTVLMMTLYLVNLVLAAWAMVPNKKIDEQEEDDIDEYNLTGGHRKELSYQEAFPSQTSPVMSSPFTPRTMAFNKLNNATLESYA